MSKKPSKKSNAKLFTIIALVAIFIAVGGVGWIFGIVFGVVKFVLTVGLVAAVGIGSYKGYKYMQLRRADKHLQQPPRQGDWTRNRPM